MFMVNKLMIYYYFDICYIYILCFDMYNRKKLFFSVWKFIKSVIKFFV